MAPLRVEAGRAILRKPKVFLFDEPLSNLAPVPRLDEQLHWRDELRMPFRDPLVDRGLTQSMVASRCRGVKRPCSNTKGR